MKAAGSALLKIKTIKSNNKSIEVYMDVDTLTMYLAINNEFVKTSSEEIKKLEERAKQSL